MLLLNKKDPQVECSALNQKRCVIKKQLITQLSLNLLLGCFPPVGGQRMTQAGKFSRIKKEKAGEYRFKDW